MKAAKQILLCIALLPMWALLPAHEATYEVTKCHCIKRDGTPDRQQLTQLHVPEKGIYVRIMDGIGSNYDSLGADLLNDEKGEIMRTIEHDYKYAEKILGEVFYRWIKGQGQKDGMKTNTWGMLVKYLQRAKLMVLADEIESVLQFCAEKTAHVDDDECNHEYGEHKHDMPLETKSTLQYLISMLAAVIYIVGQGAAIFRYKSHNTYGMFLKSLYKTKTLQASSSDADHWPPSITNKAFRLAMIMSEEVQRRNIDDDFVRETITGKVDDILRRKVPIKLGQIFDKIEEGNQKKVLIEGAPGCGKSTLSLHICHEWTAGRLFVEYSQVILVRLREITVQNAKTIADLLPRRDEAMARGIEKKITACNGEGVLFVFDGWDELPKDAPGRSIIEGILCSKTLTQSSIIITSRPISSESLHTKVNSRIEILGFTKDELQQYFAHCLKDDAKVIELQRSIQENPVVAASCYLPLNASILVHLFKCRAGVLPRTQFGIFSALICNCIYRHQRKNKHDTPIKSLDKLPPEVEGPFKDICKIAYDGVIEDRIIFVMDRECGFNTLGLLQGVECFAHSGMPSCSYNFLHLSIQELLAAIHMTTQLEPSEQVVQFKKLFGQARFSAVFQFYTAKTKLQKPEMNEIVIQIVQKCMQDEKATELTSHSGTDSDQNSDSSNLGHKPQPLLLSLLHCLFEAQDQDLCQLVVEELKGKLNLRNISLSPADCLSVGYFLTHCRQFKVHLGGCSIGDDGCKALFRTGQKYDLQYLDLLGNSIGDEGAKALSEAVKTMTNLQTLYLINNAIGDEGAKALSEAMKTMTNLQLLHLLYNAIGAVGREALEEAAKETRTEIIGIRR